MTLNTTIYGYQEAGYLGNPYLTSNAIAAGGIQAQFVIESAKALGLQTEFQIKDYLKNLGLQANLVINSSKPLGIQFSGEVDTATPAGLQAELKIVDYLESLGLQAEFAVATDYKTGIQSRFTIDSQNVVALQYEGRIEGATKKTGIQYRAIIQDFLKSGVEFRSDDYPSLSCENTGYLDEAYLTKPYLAETWCIHPGIQANFVVQETTPVGLQAELQIKDYKNNSAIQMLFNIVDYKKFSGLEFDVQVLNNIALQFLAAIYNTTNLRILCDFASRGIVANNWTANSTEPGDFLVSNLNTDIVEQIWRSATGVITGLRLDCDVGVAQGAIIDTLAILNHNMTSSATITLLGSDNPGHAPVGVTIPLETRVNNMYYISPDLPSTGYRYWRFEIDDATNPASFVSIGSILFGTSQIFHQECFVDRIDFQLKDFADTVATEGFTNVANSRTIKRSVRLDFRVLEANFRNFKILRSIFENVRTTLKCLWIPTPDPEDQEITAKFATFGKLTTIPSETHNNKGAQTDYVDLTVEVDESL